jgi:hypothetical protein
MILLDNIYFTYYVVYEMAELANIENYGKRPVKAADVF